MRLQTIDRKLASLPLGQTLHLLAQVAFEADRSVGDRAQQVRLASSLLPASVMPRVERLLSDPTRVALSSQVVLALAVRALAVERGPTQPPERSKERLARSLGPLIFALARHTTTRDGSTESLIVELARLDLYSRVHDLGIWWDVAAELFFDIVPKMTDHPEYIDAAGIFQSANGIELVEYWALSAGFGAVRMTTLDNMVFPQQLGPGSLSEDVQAKWMDLLSAPLEKLQQLARQDLSDNQNWSFGSLMLFPILPIGGGRGVVSRPAFLGRKASPSSLFWAVRHAVVKAGGHHQRWANFFGSACEQLGRRWLLQAFPDVLFEETIDARWPKPPGIKTCDAVIRDGPNLVAIDFVYRQMTKETLATGGYGDLVRDVGLAATSKFRQIDDTLGRIDLTGIERVYSLVVVGAPFPSQPPIFNMIDTWADTEATFIGRDPRSAPPAIMELTELLLLLQGRCFGFGVSDLLRGWLESQMLGASFRNWYTTDGPGEGADGEGTAWATVRKTLFPGRFADGHSTD